MELVTVLKTAMMYKYTQIWCIQYMGSYVQEKETSSTYIVQYSRTKNDCIFFKEDRQTE